MKKFLYSAVAMSALLCACGDDSPASISCSSEPLEDSTGVVIYCNGDSVGVVYNGKDGADGENGKDGKDGADGKDLTSSSWKAPFAFFLPGSEYTGYELSGSTSKYTGNNIYGSVSSSDGRIDLESTGQVNYFAEYVVEGYYVNPVTGKVGDGTLRLHDFAWLNEKSSFPTYLSHLEWFRANYLMNHEDMKSAVAKRQATFELFAQFHIDSRPWDLYLDNVKVADSDNGAGLALLLLLQGERSTAEMSAFLSSIMEKDWSRKGVISGSLLSEMADWAIDYKKGGKYSQIREQLENRKLGKVPEFETYLDIFWARQCGLGTCDSDKDGTVKRCADSLSSYYAKSVDSDEGSSVRFVCKKDSWSIASDDDIKNGKKSDEVVSADIDMKLNYCGDETFDAEKQFCEGGKTYDKCDGQTYDVATKICADNKVVAACGGKSFDDSKQFCYNNESYDFWDGTYKTFTDDRDNEEYKYVVIGAQTWMAENLRFNPNTATVDYSWCNVVGTDKCKYGRYYSWSASCSSTTACAPDVVVQGVCPDGWHVPSRNDFTELVKIARATGNALDALKSKSWCVDENCGKDLFGFGAMPSGYMENAGATGTFEDVGSKAYYLSTSASQNYVSMVMPNGSWVNKELTSAAPVRCVKDPEPAAEPGSSDE